MLNPTLTKAYSPGAAVLPYRICKFSADGTVVQAAAATDKSIGVSTALTAASTDTRVDVYRTGIAEVTYGGTVAVGDLLTSDADGKAVVAAPSAGVNNRIIGIAEVAGVSGDVGSMLISPCSLQGA